MKITRQPLIGTFIIVAALLLCGATAHAKNERIPSEFFGVTLGTSNFDDAATSLEAQGWEIDVEDGDENDEDNKNFYLFIFGSDKPLNYFDESWASAMFVADDRESLIIEDVSLISSYMTLTQATRFFTSLTPQLRKQYKGYITRDDSQQLLVRQGGNFMAVSLDENENRPGSWYVTLIVSISDPTPLIYQGQPTTGRTTTTTSGTSSVLSGATLPHSLLGVEIGKTKRSNALKILKKQGLTPEVKDSEQYISVSPEDNLTIAGYKVSLVNIYFDNPKTKVCSSIYSGIVFDDGSEARAFIRATADDLMARYPGCTLVDEQNKVVLRQNGYYLLVERQYLEDAGSWIAIIVFSDSMPD